MARSLPTGALPQAWIPVSVLVGLDAVRIVRADAILSAPAGPGIFSLRKVGSLRAVRSTARVPSPLLFSILLLGAAAFGEEIRLAEHPALSPDGKTLLFSWRGDIWVAGDTRTVSWQGEAGMDKPKNKEAH